MKRDWIRGLSLVVAAALWLPALSWCFEPDDRQVRANGLAAHHVAAFARDGGEAASLRVGNPEWDLMRRMYTVMALADRAIAGKEREAALRTMDGIVGGTLAEQRAHGSYHFLLGYARARPWQYSEGRSLFVDGEILMMLAVRQMVEREPAYDAPLTHYMSRVAEQIGGGPIVCGESYPDECWTFCNTTALAALRIADAVRGTDHRGLTERWLSSAKTRLLDADTGLLVSSYTWNGVVDDGPEGSSIWMSVHNLQLIDAGFARDQYERARAALAIDVLGFGLAREWPRGTLPAMDIDSGPVIPVLGASAGSSGLALLGAASFGDDAFFDALSRSLEFAAFPIKEAGRLRYAAAGPMGDAVAFAAHEVGPLWRAVAATLEARR